MAEGGLSSSPRHVDHTFSGYYTSSMRCSLLRALAVPMRGARATRAWQEGEVASEKEGRRKISNSSVWELPLPGLCKSLYRSVQEQQVSPDMICHAKPTSQTGFPDSPWGNEYPSERERAFSHPFMSSLPLALLGALLLWPNHRIWRVPAAVCAQHRHCRGWC